MSQHIFALNGSCCVDCFSNFATHGFENWGISIEYSPVLSENIQPRDALKPIARERKCLVDYKLPSTIEKAS